MRTLKAFVISGLIFLILPAAKALNAEEIYGKVNKSVYTLYTVNFYDKRPDSLGSAIAVTDHILATNCHVALTGNYLGIVINNEFKLGTLFFRDTSRDICFVEVPGVQFVAVKIRDSKDVKVGEPVYAVGNPEGLEKSISQGIVSNKRKDRGGYVLQTDASVSFGSSGGGLFDQNGSLIGITNSVDRESKNIAFAIPTEWITQILFPKASGEEKIDKQTTESIEEKAKSIKKIGSFGKSNISLYQYNQKCFVYFLGKNEYGEPVSSAIWYPEKPGIILIFPASTDLTKDFHIMNEAFYETKEANPEYSSDYLNFGDKKYQLVGVKDENGKFPLLVTKLPEDAKDKFPQISNFTVKYKDNVSVEGYSSVTYGLDGFKDTMNEYQKQCRPPVSSKRQER